MHTLKVTCDVDPHRRQIRCTVLALALPIVGSDLLQRGVNVVDALLVGRLGAAELAAVGLSQLFLMFVMALVYGLGWSPW
jgi:Na+-driven multidrug efflux pump